MSRCNWSIEISAYLDGNLKSAKLPSVEKHLRECAECASFCAEQRKLNQILVAALPDLEVPPQIWSRIEVQLEAGPSKVTGLRFWDLLRIPRLSYAAASLVLLLAVFLFIFVTPNRGDEEERMLAELEAFSLEVEGNPFLRDVQADNPFFQFSQDNSGNPFERVGGGQR